jgi:error-prone DNA polymerase
MPALGILDRDGFYGAPRLYMTAKKLGLRSHIGAEISTVEFGNQVLPESWQPHTIPERPVRLSVLCESQTGYKDLSQLITGYKLQQKSKSEGVAPYPIIEDRLKGLVCLTGGDEGPLAAALTRWSGRRAPGTSVSDPDLRAGKCLCRAANDRIREQKARNQAAITLARELHLPLLATNGANMATAFEREVLDLMTAIRHGCTPDEAGLLLQQNTNRQMIGAPEMTSLFRDLPYAVAETVALSSGCSL